MNARNLPAPDTYSLRIDLADVGETLCERIGGHLVPVLVSEFGGLTLRSLRKGSGVGNGAGYDTADGGGDFEDVGDGSRVNQLVLQSLSV